MSDRSDEFQQHWYMLDHDIEEVLSHQHAISQLRIVRSGLHLVTYLDVGNFCHKSIETTLHEICVQVLLRFSDSSKPSQSVLLIYEFALLAWVRKSEENLLKTSCKVALVTKVAHIFWWCHDNWKKWASARAHWCDVSCDIPYFKHKIYISHDEWIWTLSNLDYEVKFNSYPTLWEAVQI